ncbi:hypothetical protein IEQ34_023930 [Dendrobium chrysotoxum]|uniref:Uncharacterized protein n=1 Tax=Dendrobium chrysotoxum TaxID=161865 RepID=A0AAV7FJI3_DENCH|nr:hypothetical protein IEQ34_024931 [Dendrobium chrysotoxum]KAH0447030.1 hypothetical protein IEQ34_024132 [Dendrobium chrysotoxum]KAH0447233.1 hypothetical protein IEQ34_023930 [Dendrobium chrysotoxum]
MSRGPPPPTRYISRLWAAITIQEDTRNWKKNLPGGLPSYKSYDTGAGFSKKPRSWVAKRAHLETWDLSRKCEGCHSTYLFLGESKWGSVLPCDLSLPFLVSASDVWFLFLSFSETPARATRRTLVLSKNTKIFLKRELELCLIH